MADDAHVDLPFKAEYAKSGRASCKLCSGSIAKESLRIAIMVQSPMFDGKIPNWYHFSCVWKRARITTHADIKGFDSLRWEDQKKVKDAIEKGGSGGGAKAGESVETKDYSTEYAKSSRSTCRGCEDKIEKDLVRVSRKDFESQRAKMYGPQDLWYHVTCFVDNRDEVGFDTSMDPTKIKGYKQLRKEDKEELLEKLGKPDPSAKRKAEKAENGGSAAKKQKTKESKEEKALREQSKLIWKYRDQLGKEVSKDAMKALLEYNKQDLVSGESDLLNAVSDCMAFGSLLPCPECKGQLKFSTSGTGYRCTGNVSAWTKCQYKTATPGRKTFKVPKEFHDVDFLKKYKYVKRDRVIASDRVDGSGDPSSSQDSVDGAAKHKKSFAKSMASVRDEMMYTKSVPSKVKMTVKGGAAVDPESGMADKTHILVEKGEPYTAILNLVDISTGTNSYYKLQILESDKSNNYYWVFRAWGRVGTTIGGNKVESCGASKTSAIDQFKELYGQKTGNEWEDRKNFVKHPKKFYPIDIDYGDDDAEVQKISADAGSNSKLPPSVQNLIKMIFDVETMKKAMLEFEIDLKKMPLGKLSKKQIESAYKVLKGLQGLIDNKGTPTQFLDLSNQFYTLIPHDFGLKKPPLLDTADVIRMKSEMLENLLEIEVAYSLLKGGNSGEKDPLDLHYEKLKTDIKPMDKQDEEYQLLLDYVKNTHAATHNQYDLEVQEIFKVAREGEYKRYRAFEVLHNRQLLWHGSRTTNYAGILSQGLRIAPPEAPVTGYMFGKGVYFADMVSKSANYCRTSKSAPVGFLLLCEVALGNMHELTASSYVTKLPKGKHSTKGVGMTHPDPAQAHTTEKGVLIPKGVGVNATQRSSLLYNEFIVYDVAQVNIKYMLQVDFKYKW